jgi:CheY-like chemotaxis protein
VTALESFGYTVLQAANGPAAMEIVRARDNVDLLFTDMIMPGGMTGHELAEQAKDQWPGLKVLYTSGYTDDALASAGKDIRLVRKPYDDTVLAKEIKEALCA